MKSPFLLYEFSDEYGNKLPKLFTNPTKILQTNSLQEIPVIFQEMETAVKEGYYAAGYLSYEAAPAFNYNMEVHHDPKLPLLWFGIFEKPEPFYQLGSSESEFSLSDWKMDMSSSDYKNGILQIKTAIEEGQTYQLNYTDRLRANFTGDDFSFYRQLSRNQQSDYNAYLNLGNYSILSASPELFFKVTKNKIKTKPMKGTAPRGRYTEEDKIYLNRLLTSEKERAENLMIVDLLRNDISRIAKSGSVKVTKLFEAETYPTVHQLTSTIEAEIREDSTLFEWFQALFPCGSITGAPKISTMQYISKLELSPREAYCGTIGYVTPERDAVFNVPIRTVIIDRDKNSASYGAGGGITWDSTPEGEYEELITKAKLLKERRPDFQLLESLKLDEGNYPLLKYHLERMQDSSVYFKYHLDIDAVEQELLSLAAEYDTGSYKVRLLADKSGAFSTEAIPVKTIVAQASCMLAKKPIDRQNPFFYHKTTNRKMYEELEKAKLEKDFSVLMWNEEEELTEFTIGNVVLEKKGKFFTPPVSSGLLAGTFRRYLIENQKIEEKVLYKHDLKDADAVWFINSVRGWVKVSVSQSSY